MGFREMITKPRLAGLLAILVLGFLVLRTGDEPTDSVDRDTGSESATERQLQNREPAFLSPSRDYGIAERRDTGATSTPYDRPGVSRSGTYPEIRPDGHDSPFGYRDQAWMGTQAYRFRPLSEQEQERIRQRPPDPYLGRYVAPVNELPRSYPPRGAQPQPVEPAPHSAPYAPMRTYPDPPPDAYSFRPLEQSPGARGRWQGPYPEPGRRQDLYPMDPWTAPSPQWGSTPPAQRMYPNLYRGSDSRLTAR